MLKFSTSNSSQYKRLHNSTLSNFILRHMFIVRLVTLIMLNGLKAKVFSAVFKSIWMFKVFILLNRFVVWQFSVNRYSKAPFLLKKLFFFNNLVWGYNGSVIFDLFQNPNKRSSTDLKFNFPQKRTDFVVSGIQKNLVDSSPYSAYRAFLVLDEWLGWILPYSVHSFTGTDGLVIDNSSPSIDEECVFYDIEESDSDSGLLYEDFSSPCNVVLYSRFKSKFVGNELEFIIIDDLLHLYKSSSDGNLMYTGFDVLYKFTSQLFYNLSGFGSAYILSHASFFRKIALTNHSVVYIVEVLNNSKIKLVTANVYNSYSFKVCKLFLSVNLVSILIDLVQIFKADKIKGLNINRDDSDILEVFPSVGLSSHHFESTLFIKSIRLTLKGEKKFNKSYYILYTELRAGLLQKHVVHDLALNKNTDLKLVFANLRHYRW